MIESMLAGLQLVFSWKVMGLMVVATFIGNFFGAVPYDRAIQKSAKELVPSVARMPDGVFAKALRRIVLKMEMA